MITRSYAKASGRVAIGVPYSSVTEFVQPLQGWVAVDAYPGSLLRRTLG